MSGASNPTDRLVAAVTTFLPDRADAVVELLAAFRAWLEDVRSAASIQSASSVVMVAEQLEALEARLDRLERERGGDANQP